MKNVQQQICNTLREICPAFVYVRDGGPALWHRCNCTAQPRISFNSLASCDCVWHTKSKCKIREWPQLSFIDKAYEAERRRVAQEIKKVRAVK